MPTKTRRRTPKSAAIVTINRPATMTPRGRRQIATWLRKTGQTLLEHGPDMALTFTARYLYR